MNEVRENLREYLFGGKAEFTLVQEGSSSAKYVFKSNKNGSCYFLYTEKLNSREVIYQGYYIVRNQQFVKAKGISDGDYNLRYVNAFLWLLRHCDKLPSVVHVYHNGKCSRCGKKLTDVESLRTGLGPTCRKMIKVY